MIGVAVGKVGSIGLTLRGGVPTNALRLNGVPVTLNGQYIILREGA